MLQRHITPSGWLYIETTGQATPEISTFQWWPVLLQQCLIR